MLLFIDSQGKLRENWVEIQETALEKADTGTPFVK
jgi:hypothetical protein